MTTSYAYTASGKFNLDTQPKDNICKQPEVDIKKFRLNQ